MNVMMCESQTEHKSNDSDRFSNAAQSQKGLVRPLAGRRRFCQTTVVGLIKIGRQF